ncbi:MAG: hypothetical protein SGPRY_012488 [Prymnesium sp.]
MLYATLQQQHASSLKLLQQRQVEAASASAHMRALNQRLELMSTQPPVHLSAESAGADGPSRGFSGVFSGFAEKLLDKSRDLKQLSRGLVADLSSTMYANKPSENPNGETVRSDGETGA